MSHLFIKDEKLKRHRCVKLRRKNKNYGRLTLSSTHSKTDMPTLFSLPADTQKASDIRMSLSNFQKIVII